MEGKKLVVVSPDQEHDSLALLAKDVVGAVGAAAGAANCHTPGSIHMVTAWMRTVDG